MKEESKILTEAEIKHKRRMLESEKLKAETLNIQIEQTEKFIEKELPMRQARLNLMNLKGEREVTEKNIKILEKQIRERKIANTK